MQIDTTIALKEWAVILRALGKGQQILLMRKGGIREETRHFAVQSDRFFLYPTYEHQKEHLLKSAYQGELAETLKGWSPEDTSVEIRYFAELVEDIEILEEERLQRLDQLHIWTAQFATERLKWKKKLPLHVFLLRIYELKEPVTIDILPDYLGCKSWIELPDHLKNLDATPVLSDEAFEAQVAAVHNALKE